MRSGYAGLCRGRHGAWSHRSQGRAGAGDEEREGQILPAVKISVDKFARAEDGHISMVQFALSDGKKVLWDEKA